MTDPLARILAGATPLGEGYSTRAFRTVDGYVVRIPRSSGAASRQRRMDLLLPALAPHLPVPIPLPVESCPASPSHPHGGTRYTLLPGDPPPDDAPGSPALADAVGMLLAHLHRVTPAALGPGIDLPSPADVQAEREAVMAVALTWLRDHVPQRTHRRLRAWWDDFRASRDTPPFAPVLTHGDLWYGNLLVDPSGDTLLAVLDWEQAAWDDPAQDLATLLHSGPGFADAALAAAVRHGLPPDPTLPDRRDWLWRYREFTGIALAVETGDAAEALDALRKLRTGPLAPLFASD